MDSLFSQTVCPDEVILVKDGPIGDELDNVIDSYVTRYPYLKVLSLVTNRGLGKALKVIQRLISIDQNQLKADASQHADFRVEVACNHQTS